MRPNRPARIPGARGPAGLAALLVLLTACGEDGNPLPDQRTLVVTPTWDEPIRLAAPGETLQLTCQVESPSAASRDVSAAAQARAARGVLQGATCASLTVNRSGIDTVRVSYEGLTATAVVAVALPPVPMSGPVGTWLTVDSMGGEPGRHWSPSLRRNSRGQMELYVTLARYEGEFLKSTLQRYLSDDNGATYRYDGVVLRPDPGYCSLRANGVENITIVPRAEAPGWRMFFAAGSNECFGWQIFSAVSTDEKNWTIEPGIRVDNGWGLLPTSSGNDYWAQGEGMAIDRLPSGEWRMLQGAHPRENPTDRRFEIVEYRSPDQLNWYYVGTVINNTDMPAGGQGSIYSPTIREFAPGMFRMVFTGDDRWEPGWYSRVYSAVSLDGEHWQIEEQLMGQPGTHLFYAALQDEQLVFIRRDPGGPDRVAVATIRMP